MQFISGIGRGVVAAFRGRHLLWHLFAIAITFALVVSGFDWWFFSTTRGEVANALGMSAGILGFIVPVALPAALYALGLLRRDEELKAAAAAAFQAVVVAWIVIAFYKALTGRIEPEFLASVVSSDNSREFNFGFWRHGIFWGWPSAHAAVAFALSSFLGLWYRHKVWVVALVAAYALYVAAGAGVSFHWLSDAIAGAIIGALVGYVMYKQTRRSLEQA